MAIYLVSAVPKHGRLEELGERLARAEFMALRPFGATLSASLKDARIRKDGVAGGGGGGYFAPPPAPGSAAGPARYFPPPPPRKGEEGEGGGKNEALHPPFPGQRRDY